MSGPWDPGFRNRKVEFEEFLSERSTSAPPPETSLLFGGNESLIAPTAQYANGFSADDKWATPYTNYDKNSTVDSLFSDFGRDTGISQSRAKPPPGFSADTQQHNVRQPIDFRSSHNISSLDSMDHQAIGEALVRSHSAAPSYESRRPLDVHPGHHGHHGHPGLSSSKTPQTCNRTSRESYLGPSLDTASILQLGQRRPASTGVIGANQNLSSLTMASLGLSPGSGSPGAVRPSAKSLMDLIQEDFPPESPLDARGFNSPYTSRNEFILERPRTTSPPSLSTRAFNVDHQNPRDDLRAVQGRLEQLNLNNSDLLGSPYQNHGETNLPHRIYAPIAQPVRPQAKTVYEQTQYEQDSRQFQHRQQQQQQSQEELGRNSPGVQQRLQMHVLPTGQTVYVSSPAPHYGYTTVQYHPSSQQHHIVHQVATGMAPQGEQYISVVPIQNNTGSRPGQGGGNYTFVQQDGQRNDMQTYAILSPSAHNPIHSTSGRGLGRDSSESHRSHHSAHRSKEKSKNRRGGASNGKRADSKHQQNGTYSPLLEDFKAKKNRNWTALDIKGHVVEFCQDQNGSRFIQQRLEVGSQAERDLVMLEVLPAIRRLRNDVFGNYVVQKLLEHGTVHMKHDIRDTLKGEMLKLSLQMYGCRVVQKALETLDDSDVPALIAEFHNSVLSCIHDQNGNHVIQKCIEVMCAKAAEAKKNQDMSQSKYFEERIEFIVSDALSNVEELSCHPYGCRVLQRILEHCPEPNRTKALNEVAKCHRTLLDDQYGNYVIQHILQYGRDSDRESILGIVVANGVLLLSRQKFASNVVEKLLKYGSPAQRLLIVREMLKFVDDRTGVEVAEGTQGTSAVLLMVRDAYANYVVQTTLDVIAEGDEKRRLMKELNAHSTELKNYTFAKHIVSKLGQ